MDIQHISYDDLQAKVQLSRFAAANGAEELHAIYHVEGNRPFKAQLDAVLTAQERLLQTPQMVGAQPVMVRYFLSDAANQSALIPQPSCALSIIQQPPLNGSKVGLWVYYVKQCALELKNNMTICQHNGYTHLWEMGMVSPDGDSATQTTALLERYEQGLKDMGANITDNCIRTWFFVRDVDTQYMGMVRARRDNFAENDLGPQTHFIASTGIGGVPAQQRAIIQLGAYALKGFEPDQVRYLYAKTHLNSTYEYGVTFERGTAVDYGDRRHVIISGTASINNKGEVLHLGDVVAQTKRMWENVEVLLAEADTTFDDVMQIVIYLRDTADYDIVNRMFQEKFPKTPYIICLAPVCRPTWLIEMECWAVKAQKNERFREF